MASLFRSVRSVRCAVTLAVIFFISGCLVAVFNINHVENRTREFFIHDNGDALRLANGGRARSNLTRNRESSLLKRLKGQINETLYATGQLKQRLRDAKGPGSDLDLPNYNVHAFYYPWYGTPEHDGKYLHWNHDRLPHWNPEVAKKWPQNQHNPPEDIGANYYPELGCYSSRDPVVIDNHMQQFVAGGIGVLVLSWYPPGKADDQGNPSDDIVPILLDLADRYKIKVAFHSEPYKGRTAKSFINDLKYLIDTYGMHPAFYRRNHRGHDLPLIYVYDSYLIKSKDWASVLKGHNSIRRSGYDAIFVGLFVEQKDKIEIVRAGFDGFYTYFASTVFTYGSKLQNWKSLAKMAHHDNLLFIPSVGPGYIDERVRPWNGGNTRARNNGRYYNLSFKSAVDVDPEIISITSFNEWHEGTQIERAEPYTWENITYHDYRPESPGYYLALTRQWTDMFARSGVRWSGG